MKTKNAKVISISPVLQDNQKPTLIPAIRNPVLSYHSHKEIGRGEFKSAEYNLAEIGRISDTDSYVHQAFLKKIALMFKEGWDLVGPNPKNVQYVRDRLAQLQRASGIPTEKLLRDIGSGIVKKSNTFLLKVRKVSASGGRVRNEPNSTLSIQPVAAYFLVPAETMEFRLSNNRIVKWRQLMPNGDYKEFSPKDIVHFYFDQKEGFIFGTPTLTPVIDDVRALRKIEENIELLVYQHLFPLFHYKVGTEEHPAGLTESGEREIDVVRREIQYAPTEGGIVTPERHEISAIGSEGRALRAEGYLTHFKKRVIAGLGISSVDLGDGDTTNRSTAENMSRNLIDGVKDIQRIIEVAFKKEIIDELLLESTFGPSVLDEENKVELKFKEIDIDAQIKKETHMADQFNKDLLTHDECRMNIGLEPVEMPDPKKSQAGTVEQSQYPEWFKTRWKMFEEPKLLIQSLDEPYSPISQAAVDNNSTEVNQPGIQRVAQQRQGQEIAIQKETAKAKQASKPAPKTQDSYLAQTFIEIKKDTIERIPLTRDQNFEWVSSLIRTQMETTIHRLLSEQLVAFRKGYGRRGNINSINFINHTNFARSLLTTRTEHYINKLTNNVISALKRSVNMDSTLQDIKLKTRAVFEAVEFRTRFIEDVEIRKAAALGEVFALRDQGVESINVITPVNSCTNCAVYSTNPIFLQYLTLDELPPYHANCRCSLPNNHTNLDSAQVSDTIINNIEDAASLEECVKSVKASLRKEHPSWDADRIKSSAFAICRSKGKK